MMDVDINSLNEQRRRIENEWRIGDQIGVPTPDHIKLYDIVLLEMKFRSNLKTAINVAEMASHFKRSSNPYFMDLAIILCDEAGVEPPPSLQAEAAKVARLRFSREEGAGTPDKIINQLAKSNTLNFVANLCHAGENLELACSKAAVYHLSTYPDLKQLKASTIEKYYTAEWRKKDQRGRTKEEEIFSRWDLYEDENAKAEWEIIRINIPAAHDELKGNRRN